MCREVVDAEGIFSREQRKDVVNPSADVGLPHTERELGPIEQRHHRHGVEHAAVDAADRERASAPHRVDGGVEHAQPVDPGLLDEFGGHRVRQQTGQVLRELPEWRAVGFHADGVDDGVGPAALGQLPDRRGRVVVRAHVDRLDSREAGTLETLVDQIDRDHTACAAMQGDPAAHLPDRAEPVDGQRATLGHLGVVDRLPRRREDV